LTAAIGEVLPQTALGTGWAADQVLVCATWIHLVFIVCVVANTPSNGQHCPVLALNAGGRGVVNKASWDRERHGATGAEVVGVETGLALKALEWENCRPDEAVGN
jgi:hypothetical protein